jgi:hypothetical protein
MGPKVRDRATGNEYMKLKLLHPERARGKPGCAPLLLPRAGWDEGDEKKLKKVWNLLGSHKKIPSGEGIIFYKARRNSITVSSDNGRLGFRRMGWFYWFS